jgi:peptidoglycan-associated lipoprotein
VKAPAMVISLDGHADARGTNAYNKTLSQKRCDSVQKYLESKGLKNKVVSTAYGEEKPVDGKIKPYFKNRVVFVKVSK